MDAYLGYVEVVDLDKSSLTMGSNLINLPMLPRDLCERWKHSSYSLVNVSK